MASQLKCILIYKKLFTSVYVANIRLSCELKIERIKYMKNNLYIFKTDDVESVRVSLVTNCTRFEIMYFLDISILHDQIDIAACHCGTFSHGKPL